jgi:hypothetical protein
MIYDEEIYFKVLKYTHQYLPSKMDNRGIKNFH